MANPGAMQDGEYLAEYTPDKYMTDIRNFSMTIDTHAGVMAEQEGRYGAIFNKVIVGGDWHFSGNTGRGLYFVGVRPLRFRPEPFDNIPIQHRLSFFVEIGLASLLGRLCSHFKQVCDGYSLRLIPLPIQYREYDPYSGATPPVYAADPLSPTIGCVGS